eukprot:2089465-Amphidinium_carterae.1
MHPPSFVVVYSAVRDHRRDGHSGKHSKPTLWPASRGLMSRDEETVILTSLRLVGGLAYFTTGEKGLLYQEDLLPHGRKKRG